MGIGNWELGHGQGVSVLRLGGQGGRPSYGKLGGQAGCPSYGIYTYGSYPSSVGSFKKTLELRMGMGNWELGIGELGTWGLGDLGTELSILSFA
ncbi:MAG: hypothetical protein F6J93_17305 [Oscillatoria sp. SIO1A7]|nr:hypothetical protein [Oscillatoria sp. SIO1A7]